MSDGTDRGQVYTLEGMAAAILVVLALLLSVQSVALTPTTPGTVDADTRAQLRVQANDALAAARTNGSLTSTALYWNASSGLFADPYVGYNVSNRFGYGPNPPPDARSAPSVFGAMLNQTFTQRGFTYNLFVEYRTGSDPAETDQQVLVRRGYPTSNAVEASFVITVYDRMRLTGPEAYQLGDPASNFYAPDVDPDGPIYNVLRIRVVVW
ncbi:DUF7288 family protein [Halorarum halobium]|uniref:DUF7288 family protein n=1 Tax=Halorarum halobium TaxID=3075121 RepID=UPI0028B1FD56|nr:hypothetical protein [Halobaculum sp. XH14]